MNSVRVAGIGAALAVGIAALGPACSSEGQDDVAVGRIRSALTSALIARGSTWRYLDTGTNQGTAWRSTSFDDSGWGTGTAEFGYGDGDESTIVSYGSSSSAKYITTYFRRSFNISDPAAVTALTLGLKRDDGAVVYLNGTEVFRSNMPSGTVSYTTRASTQVENNTYYTSSISPSLLIAGTNVIAVEVHQGSASSTDLSMDFELVAEISEGGGSGGNSGTAGSSGIPETGGTPSTGGTSTGGTSTGGTSTGGESYGFFVMSDVHVSTSAAPTVATAIAQMDLIDPAPVAAVAAGDLTDYPTTTQWGYFNTRIGVMFDRNATAFDPTNPRFLSAMGNHDVYGSSWYTNWNNSLSGQRYLGSNSQAGIYFATSYQNSLFVVLDAQHPSTAQTSALATALQGSSAQFKFLFWHNPIYICESSHTPFGAGLAWVDLAEENDVDVVFNGHSHVYTRTCPKYLGNCVSDGTGVVYVETGSLGTARLRTPNVTTSSVTGTDAQGNPRTDTYNCNTGAGGHLHGKLTTAANTFCHVGVSGCSATVRCYTVGAGNTTPFDSWTIDHCG